MSPKTAEPSTLSPGFKLSAVLAIAAGAALPLGFAPYHYWWLLPLALAGLFCLSRHSTKPLLTGWLFGLGLFGHGVWWIQVSVHQFGLPSYFFSVPVTAVFIMGMALYPALVSTLVNRYARGIWRSMLVAASAWTLAELIRAHLFTGFPWLALGYSQTDGPLRGLLPIVGVFGTTLVIALLAAMLSVLKIASLRQRVVLSGLIIGLMVTGVATRQLEFSQPAGENITAALIQGAIPQALKWQPELRDASIAVYEHLSAPHWDADIVIWPETAIAAFPHEVEPVLQRLSEQAHRTATTLLIGMPSGEPWQGTYYNSVLAFGEQPGRYSKTHLVPFGEFFPFKKLLEPLAAMLSIPLSDFSRGEPTQSLLGFQQHRLGISICYEDAFGMEVRRTLPEAAVLVNVSNDAWFGDTIAPHQHLQIARARALESSRYLLRATNTGVSAIINERGEVSATTAQFNEASVRGLVVPRQGTTPYVLLGDWPVWALSLVMLLLAMLQRRGAPSSE